MTYITINGAQVEVDEDGFMIDPNVWTEDFVHAFARIENVEELTEKHWTVVNYLRDYYKLFGIAPMIHKLAKGTGFTLKEISELFPSGPAKSAFRLAGLPKPTDFV